MWHGEPVATYLLVWNPNRWEWDAESRAQVVAETARRPVDWTWSSGGRRRGLVPGQDEVYLVRVGRPPKGIVAHGMITRAPYPDAHWDPTQDRSAWYIGVAWDRVVHDDQLLALEELKAVLPDVTWTPPGSGLRVPDGDADVLAALWRDSLP